MMKKLFLLFLLSFMVNVNTRAQVIAPFTESFSNSNVSGGLVSAVPAGWTNTASLGSSNWRALWRTSDGRIPTTVTNDATPLNDHTGANGYFLWVESSYLSQTGNQIVLETSYINMVSLSSPELSLAIFSFDTSNVQQAPNANKLKVDFYNGTTWHDSIFIYQDQSSPVWETQTIDLTPYTTGTANLNNCKFRFKVEAVSAPHSSGYNIYNSIAIDDISVRDPGACNQPDSLTVSNITAHAADLDWKALAAAATYEVEYWVRFNRFQQGSSTVTTVGDTVTSTGNSVQLTGLKSNTPYAARVRSVCQGGGFSHWSPAIPFETSCGAITAPYTNDFETYDWNRVDSLPSCWNFYCSEHTTPNSSIENWYALSYSKPLYLNFAEIRHVTAPNFHQTDTTMLILPSATDLTAGDKQLSFQLSVASSQPIIVGTLASPNPKSQFSPVKTIVGDSSVYDYAYQKVVIPFTSAQGYNGVDTHIAIRVEGKGLNLSSRLDDVDYNFIPACPEINKVVFTERTDSSASFNIDVASYGNSFDVVWGALGFNHSTGGIGAGVVTGNSFTISDSVDNSASPTGLHPGSRYELYLKNVCDNNYYGPVEFTTVCSPFTAPYYTGFETSNLLIEDCWRSYTTSRNRFMVNDIDSVNPFTGARHINMDNSASRILGDTLLVMSPFFSDLTDGNKRIRFQLRSDEQPLQRMFAPQSGIIVGTMGSEKPSDFVPMDTIYPSQSATYEEVIVQFDSLHRYNGIDTLIGFMHAFQANYENFYIDEFHYENNPCGNPTDLTAVNVVDSGATLEWNKSLHSNAYEIWVGPAGFYQGTQTTGGVKATVNSTSLALDTLSDLSCFEYVVRTLCSSDSSQWVGPYKFCTPCEGPLAGSYTIGQSASADYNSFSEAAQHLSQCGVSGAVIFNLQPGNYTDTLHLKNIPGLSHTNTLTFNGNGDTLKHPSSAETRNTIALDSISYLTIRDLNLDRGSHSRTITPVSIDNSSNIAIDSCIFHLNLPGSLFDYGITISNSDSLIVSNNTIHNAGFGIEVIGTGSDPVTSVLIENNELMNFPYAGIYMQHVESVIVRSNDVSSQYSWFFPPNGVVIDECYDVFVTRNSIRTLGPGVYLQNGNSSNFSNMSLVSNNMVISENSEGLYLSSFKNVGVYHNTVSGKPGLLVKQQDSVDIRNNIFTSPSDVAAEFADGVAVNDSIDYNIYFRADAATPLISENSTSYNDLTAWQSANSAYNGNSLQGDPVFISSTDLHLAGIIANNAGDTTLNITEDIDGDARLVSSPLVVDIGADEYTPLMDDLSAFAILGPLDGACGDSAQAVSVVVANHGLQAQSNFDVTLNLSGASAITQTVTYPGSLPVSGSDTVFIANLNLGTGGQYQMEAYTQLSGDQSLTNDTVRLKITQFSSMPPIPVVDKDTLCLGDTAVLYIPMDGGSYQWESMNGNTVVNSDSLIVGPLYGTDTTIVLRPLNLPVPDTIGEKNLASISSTSSSSGGLRFKVKRPFVLDSVKVYSATSGGYVIKVVDNQSSQTLHEDTLSIVGSTNAIWLPLHYSLSPGDYSLHGTIESLSAIPLLSYNDGPSDFPYIVDGALEIYESFTKYSWAPASPSTVEYRYFYDWQISLPDICRSKGQITLHSDSSGAVNATFISNPGAPGPADLTVAFDANSSSGGSTYSWDFGDGNTGTGVMSSHTYTSNGTYNVQLVVIGNCGSDTITQQVIIQGISVVENELDKSLNIYPNPATNEVVINFRGQNSSAARIKIRDMSGRLIYHTQLNNLNGNHLMRLDVSQWAKSIYMVEVRSGDMSANRKITKQ